MNKHIQDILTDLYKIDPALKAHEKELVELVSTLMSSKPDTKFDEDFASRLRSELMQVKVRPVPTPYGSFFVSRAFYGIVGSALTILIVVPLTFIATQKATSPDKPIVLNPFVSPQVKDETAVLTPKQQISNKGMNAFGKLALVPTTASGMGGNATQDSATAKSAQTTTLVAPNSASSTTGPEAMGKGASAVSTMPVHQNNSIAYTYKGDQVAIKEQEGQVFMRTKGIDSSKQLSSIIQNSNFGLAKISSFSNLKLSNIVLNEDKDNGYSIAVNFDDGTINISSMWDRSTLNRVSEPLPASAMPGDATLIGIADAFVKEHNIDTTIYGKPVVQAMSLVAYGKGMGNGEGFAPDMVTVMYPLIIEGKPVYESNGFPFGLAVMIDVRAKKVAGVNNLTSQTYDSSLYSLETNFSEIVKAATTSLANYYGMDPASGTMPKAGTLGTPQHVLMHYWNYDEKSGASSELYIPALSFPISYDAKNTQGLPTTIVVPLVKDFLAKQTVSSGGAVEPMVPSTTSAPVTKPE